MTKNEWVSQFETELHNRKVTDAAEVAEEYGQHVAFKPADGYSEEELVAKPGFPVELAAQFKPTSRPAKHSAILTWLWLGWVDLFFGIFEILPIFFGIVPVSCVLPFGVTGICPIAASVAFRSSPFRRCPMGAE